MEKDKTHSDEVVHHDKTAHDNKVVHHDEDGHDEIVVDEEAVKLDSFKRYPSSDDDKTKIIDGEKVVEDFHLYKEDADMDKE